MRVDSFPLDSSFVVITQMNQDESRHTEAGNTDVSPMDHPGYSSNLASFRSNNFLSTPHDGETNETTTRHIRRDGTTNPPSASTASPVDSLNFSAGGFSTALRKRMRPLRQRYVCAARSRTDFQYFRHLAWTRKPIWHFAPSFEHLPANLSNVKDARRETRARLCVKLFHDADP